MSMWVRAYVHKINFKIMEKNKQIKITNYKFLNKNVLKKKVTFSNCNKNKKNILGAIS